MKLTLRPEWKPQALTTFVWFIDLKTGVKIVLLFAMLNKVAGLYGLIAMLVGAGGAFLQISMYLYSVLGLGAYAWGLKATAEESPSKSLMTAHIFLVDHLLSTIWTVLLAIDWWVYNLHDGQRPPLSQVQQDIIDVGPGKPPVLTPEELKAAVQQVWNKEKGSAATIMILGWLVKFYFAALIYSYAIHLRKGTYRSLPLTHAVSHSNRTGAANDTAYHPLYENELDAHQDLEADGMWDVRTPMDSHGDIDFDADEWDGPQRMTDIERGRRARGVGQVLGMGVHGELQQQQQKPSGAGSSRITNAGGSKRTSPRTVASKPIASSPLSPRPQPSRSNTQQQRVVSPPKVDKSRAAEIQRELEQLGAPKAADWEDDDADESGKGGATTQGRTERLTSVTPRSPRRSDTKDHFTAGADR
ncbi:hypothetical protein FRB94_008147 [Tulasnella sp. JGI-2019a]|nr:hypothetical protein FRB94_008147 [Tulasnella sp. JGI-2019a]KAG9018413.1 hypothetical protein FRB93_000116 [Tulasnella sp. JGI-2019a]KAG9037533.1 hypothetical protein FRB95_005115 [Tulasnella sp. JGI-2019a]